jgi:hypothetical protein
MRKLALISLLLLAAPAFAGENTCLDSTGNFTAPKCDAQGSLQVTGGTNIYSITVTPTVEAALYAAGDCLHAAAIELTSAATFTGGTGEIVAIEIADKQGQSKNMNAYFFTASPSTICAAINGTFDPADADLLLMKGPIRITSHAALTDNGVSLNIVDVLPYKAAATSLWLALVPAEAITPAVGDLSVKVTLKRN